MSLLNTSLTAHNWQNWKKSSPLMLLPWNDSLEAVALKNSTILLKITNFVDMWNFGKFLEKSVF